MKRLLVFLLIIILNYSFVIAQNYNCTMVIGYSQVGASNGGWYVAGTGTVSNFEQIVDDTKWQLLWNSGGGVDKWKNPNYSGWNNNIQSSCLISSNNPERIVFSVSGPHGTNISAWVNDINSTINTIQLKYPLVQNILLQPVVGGPSHQTCYVSGDSVRASWQHNYIDSAISIVSAQHTSVWSICSPEVNSCIDYKDLLGHLDTSIAHVIGAEIAQCYVSSTGSILEYTYDINLYPNPTNDLITLQIKGFSGFVDIEVYDLSGRLLHFTNSNTISLKDYAKGIYVFRVSYIDKIEKVIVVRY